MSDMPKMPEHHELPASSIMAFVEAINGSRGSLDAWLECNNEAEVREHILAYADHHNAARQACVAQLREQVMGCVPPALENEWGMFDRGYSECRAETLANLQDLFGERDA